jgi:hypothetical protein
MDYSESAADRTCGGAQGTPVPHELPEDLSGKKIATQIGYHYALIEPDLAAGRTTRLI